MTNPPSPLGEVPREPLSPRTAFGWAAVWLLVAIAGLVAMAASWPRIADGALTGQRTAGFLLITPVLALAAAIVLGVLGARSVPRTREFRARWDEQTRRTARRRRLQGEPWPAPLALGSVLGVLWIGGLVGLVVFVTLGPATIAGIGIIVVLLTLLAMVWIPLLRTAIARRAAQASR